MKKIVFLEQTLNAGGAERVTVTVIRSLNSSEFDNNLVLISEFGELKDLIPKTVKVHNLCITNTRKSIFRLRKKLKEINPDIVYSTLSHLTVTSILARFGQKYKIVARYPSMPSIEKKEGRLYGWRYFLMKLLYRKVDIVVAQTDEMALELQQFYKIDDKKIKVVMNPVDKISIEKSIENADNPFENGKINVVASGRMGVEKGFDVLLESFNQVVKKNDRFHLHILGRDVDGNLERFQKRVLDFGVSDNVTFHGFQKNPYPYYKFCDLFVLSSRREGLPNVVLECQYLGKPVVATRCIPVIERLIDHGRNGFVVDVEDTVGLARSMLDYRQLKGEKIYRDSVGDFKRIFEEV